MKTLSPKENFDKELKKPSASKILRTVPILPFSGKFHANWYKAKTSVKCLTVFSLQHNVRNVFFKLMYMATNHIAIKKNILSFCPVDWGCRIHRLLLCRRVRPHNECSVYNTKQSDGEVPAVLEVWGMRSTLSLPSLPGPLLPGVVAPDRALSMG